MSSMYFQHTQGSKKGELESFELERVRIGRLTENDLRFDLHLDREVSGNHAEVYLDGETFFIEDLRSSNGTYVNGRRINSPTPLIDGDVISFSANGPKVTFSTRVPTLGTIVVSEQDIPRQGMGVGSKTVAMMISDALREAKAARGGRFGSTTIFMREILKQASSHSSRRLRVAVICLAILLVQITAALIYVNYQKGGELVVLKGKISGRDEAIDRQRDQLTAQEQRVREQQQELEKQKQAIEALKTAFVTAAETAGLKITRAEPNDTVTGSDDGPGSVKGGTGKKTERDVVTVRIQESLLFPLDSYELTPEGRERTKTVAEILKDKAPGRKVFVEGHASQERDGQETYNQSLSEKRARNVADVLVMYGVVRSSLEAKGLGHSQPVASNDTEEERRQNRRVEVKVDFGE